MRAPVISQLAACLLLAVMLLGCTGGHPVPHATSKAPAAGATGSPAAYPTRPVTMADARNCPVTIGHRGPRSPTPAEFFGWASSYGSASLRVGGLWPHGVIRLTPDLLGPNGEMGMKFGWWRGTFGSLTISGRRLDGPAPPLMPDVATSGPGTGFQASGVVFPTEGCWQVTGKVGHITLSFVTFVIKTRA
jgi:hypothetical protein